MIMQGSVHTLLQYHTMNKTAFRTFLLRLTPECLLVLATLNAYLSQKNILKWVRLEPNSLTTPPPSPTMGNDTLQIK